MIQRSCNPRKSAELNPYWVDFEKGGEKDALTWGGVNGWVEYDKGIRNSVCGGKDDGGGGKYGPFYMDGFTKGSKSTSAGGGQKGFATTTTITSSSSFLPVEEASLSTVDGGTTEPPLLSSTSPDGDTGKVINTSSSFLSATPSSASIALQDDNNNNDENTIRLDSKLFIRRRTRKRATGHSWGLDVLKKNESIGSLPVILLRLVFGSRRTRGLVWGSRGERRGVCSD